MPLEDVHEFAQNHAHSLTYMKGRGFFLGPQFCISRVFVFDKLVCGGGEKYLSIPDITILTWN